MTKKRIRLIYRILLSASLVISGVLLMVACVGIYRSGDSPFSRESVAAAFGTISIPVYITLAILIGGFILEILLPEMPKKLLPEKQYDAILQRLSKKLDVQQCQPAILRGILAQQKKRKILQFISLGILAVCSVIFLIYGLNIRNFPLNDATGSVQKSMWLFLPCLAMPFGFAVYAAYAKKASICKEIDLVKEAIAQGSAVKEIPQQPAPKASEKPMQIAKYAILFVAVGILIYGFLLGGTKDVLTKAINICTECVGLG